jgi:hypothetical protein
MEHSIIKETGNQVDTFGTSLKGEIVATYYELTQTFGEPRKESADDKVTREWSVKFLNNEIATIYDWKDDDCLEGAYRWHIGGFNNSVVADVQHEYRSKMEEIKEKTTKEYEASTETVKEKEKDIHYFYLQMMSRQMLIAYRDSTNNKLQPTWHWAVSLTTSERALIDELPGNLEVTPSKEGESFGCNRLHQLRRNIEEEALKEYEVEVEFTYEIEHDFGVAGYITLYGEEGCMINVEAKNEEDATTKAEDLLSDEYDIEDITVTNVDLT